MTAAMRPRTEDPRLVREISIRPRLLRVAEAARILSRSPSWLRKQMAEDRREVTAGRVPQGPAWITIRGSVFFRPDALDEWISRHAIERGRGGAK